MVSLLIVLLINCVKLTRKFRRLYNKDQEVFTRIFLGIGASIRIGREMHCLPYTVFFIYIWLQLVLFYLTRRVNFLQFQGLSNILKGLCKKQCIFGSHCFFRVYLIRFCFLFLSKERKHGFCSKKKGNRFVLGHMHIAPRIEKSIDQKLFGSQMLGTLDWNQVVKGVNWMKIGR